MKFKSIVGEAVIFRYGGKLHKVKGGVYETKDKNMIEFLSKNKSFVAMPEPPELTPIAASLKTNKY